ncbi:uncharacterized protein RJT20DRAFT_53981 [Scheffersomyces xylosifermentans]|uniref:uncharacterized protein n=1 Tax=Scheffersomyces xylosifermentans TaxID=1304137 RepID=UPI00315DBD53
MVGIYYRYYTPFDRFFNKFKRGGFWIYSGLIVASTLYLIFSLSRLPSIPPPPKRKPKLPETDETVAKVEARKEAIKEAVKEAVAEQQQPVPENAHIVYSWSRRELYSYLMNERIYPDVDDDLNTVRNKAIVIYDTKNPRTT